MSDPLSAEVPAVRTTTTVGHDPMGQVERAQALFEKGPITAVASFFAISFFVALYLLLRAKDKHQTDQARETSRLTEKYSEEITALYTDERDRAVKHEVTMSNYLDMMDDVRFIAFEMRRVKLARERRRKEPTDGDDSDQSSDGDSDG